MRNIRYIVIFIIISAAFSCVQMQPIQEPEAVMKQTPVSVYIYRMGGDLKIEMAIAEKEWDYTSVLSDDGLQYTLVVKNLSSGLGKVDYVRPVIGLDRTDYPSGFKLVFTLASRHKLYASRNDLGLQIVLTALEPDMEILSMNSFGPWASPEIPAATFQGSVTDKDITTVEFDSAPVYAKGESGGRYYLDVFNVSILPGIVKHKGLLATNRMEGKTRFIFGHDVEICPQERTLVLGRECRGYTGLSGFVRDKNEKTESFLFSLPGRPEMSVMEMDGLVAFGFEDTRLFSGLFKRYNDGDVYKVEARRKDGKLWLIFLYKNELKYRKYYSGDKFFVVFYRNES
ncbi:MAG: hypothetical protein C0602_05705 [Denitrovibrio sp.]|nr:MAG: hypothetical protein C0602_05705 [Denitrovibrio sp.]